jgi:hypothetical protein
MSNADSGKLNPWPEQELRRPTEPGPTRLEWKAPLALFLLGLAVILGAAFLLSGPREVAVVLGEIAIRIGVSLPVTVAALFLVAALAGITFGVLTSAIVKLASIDVFFYALFLVGILLGHPLAGLLVATVLCWYLFSLFFDLDLWETVVSIVLLALIQYGLYLLLAVLLRGDVPS